MNRLFTFIALLVAGAINFQPMRPPLHFRMQRVAAETYESVGAFDVNGDERPDLLSGGFWYEGPGFTVRHTVGDVRRVGEYYDDFSTIPMDINGDGRLDFVTGGWWGQTLRWYENPGTGKPQGPWPEHIIGQCGNVETTMAWDVDGDSYPELVPNNPNAPFKFYRLNRTATGQPTGTFSEHRLRDSQGHGLGFGDINSDGRPDFILSDGWLEAPIHPLTDAWTWHAGLALGSASVPIIVADVNGDGRNDLIAGQAHDYGLNWYEQTAQRTWTKHLIDPNQSQFHTMAWLDLDGDQKPELLTGKRYRAHNDNDPGSHDDYGLYYYQWTGAGFAKQVISYGPLGTGKGTGIQMAITDLNADVSPDIVVAGKDGLSVFFNEGRQP